MRTGKGIWAVALVAGLAAASVASAQDTTTIWFTSPSATSQGQGMALMLPGPGTYTVTAMAQTAHLRGYSIDLLRNADTGLTAANVTYSLGALEVQDSVFYNFNEYMIWAAGQATNGTTTVADGQYALFSFDLTIAPGSVGNVYAGIGVGTFANAPQNVVFGGNTGLDGTDSSAVAPLPVIVIPEPASLALIGLGTLALLRRRR